MATPSPDHHWSRTNREWFHQRRWNRRYERGTVQAAANERLPATPTSTAARRKGRRRRRRCRQWVMSRMTPVSTVSGRSPIPTLTLVDKWRASPAVPGVSTSQPVLPRLVHKSGGQCLRVSEPLDVEPNSCSASPGRDTCYSRPVLSLLTRHEIRRLFTGLRHQPPGSRIHLHWSRWRRRHQATAWGLPLSCIMAGVSNGGEDTGSSCRMRPKSAVPTRHASSS